MELVEGYDHRPGVHCGATALRNVTEHYGWRFSEAACFGIGGGPAFVRHDRPGEPWWGFRTSPTWLERAFFERLGVAHLFGEGDDFETAWGDATDRVDDDDPVILFLDPAPLPYLDGEPAHLPPHVAVLVGYGDETVRLSDGATEDRQEVSRSTLRSAWLHDGVPSLENEYLVVTGTGTGPTEEETDAAAAGLRGAATYMLEPLQVKRDARGPGEEGLSALRSFGDALGTWPDLADSTRPVRAARRSIDEHGEGAAYRGLYADALGELGRRTGIPTDVGDRMADVAREWGIVAGLLDEILAEDDPGADPFAEAASVVGDIADREEELFEDIAEELGRAGD
jgi:hypothetical protein